MFFAEEGNLFDFVNNNPWGYFLGLFVFISSIVVLFVFKDFWAKTAQKNNGAYVRYPIAIILIVSQIYWYVVRIKQVVDYDFTTESGTWDQERFNLLILNNVFYMEVCNLVAWCGVLICLFPNATKRLFDSTLTLALIGPVMVMIVPSKGGFDMDFNSVRYWQFYYGHWLSIMAYVYPYMFGIIKFEWNKQYLIRSFSFAWIFSTFVMVWNLLFAVEPIDELDQWAWNLNGEQMGYPAFIFRDVFNNTGFGYLPMWAQYFLLNFLIGPIAVFGIFMLLYIFRPLYIKNGNIKSEYRLTLARDFRKLVSEFELERFSLIAKYQAKNAQTIEIKREDFSRKCSEADQRWEKRRQNKGSQ
ncbi:YwaF family protein [Mesoplasma photuris]|uniref:TMEM164 family acyltransferase n=1 Tax=Mesoplasma photuris TaxID=217731 RepID=UPI0004E19F41|nr:YwaF family protein [Mesoplasma photuris]